MEPSHIPFILALTFVLAEATPCTAQSFDPSGGPGYADGTGDDARFSLPIGVAVDSAGNVYVGDYQNHTIRKIASTGEVSTLAGLAGSVGSSDGTGSIARFNNPMGVTVDSFGNVYVVDNGSSTIRMITPAGVVTTPAGLAGNRGSADGTGSDARFNAPSGVAADSAGNVYVVDRDSNGGAFDDWLTIRKLAPGGMVNTLAVLASSVRNGAYRTSGVTVDSAGNVYVANGRGPTIQIVTPDGEVSTLAGLESKSGSEDAVGSDARFNMPAGVAVDRAGNVYVADSWNHTIRKIAPDGLVTTLAGLAGSEGGADGTGAPRDSTLPLTWQWTAPETCRQLPEHEQPDDHDRPSHVPFPGPFLPRLLPTRSFWGVVIRFDP